PLTDLATANGFRIGPPQTSRTTLLLDAQAAAMMDRTADAFGGIPLNALDQAANPQWGQPVLTPVSVPDPAALVRSMAIGQGKAAVKLMMDGSHVNELLKSGS